MRALLIAGLVALSAVSVRAQAPAELVEHTALGGRVRLLAPAGFGLMREEMIQRKYPTQQRPTEVLSDERGTVNVALGHSQAVVTPQQIPVIHPAMEARIRSTYPSARWNRSEVVERDGRSYVYMDFWSPTADGEVRNIMVATSVDGRLLVVSFNATRELEAEWGPLGERIMGSIRVVE